ATYVVPRVLDDSFIVVKDERGEVRVLLNMCRHRGMQVCRAELGNASHFRCPYHAWTYRNTGELIGVVVPRRGVRRRRWPRPGQHTAGGPARDGHPTGDDLHLPGRGSPRLPRLHGRVRVLHRLQPAPERRGDLGPALGGASELEDRGRELR